MPTKRSKLCEILGVDYDEEFEYCSTLYKIILDEKFQTEAIRMLNTERKCVPESSYLLIEIINNTDEIIHRKNFTPQEIADAKVLHRVWNMDKIKREGCVPYMVNADDNETILRFDAFPSIQNGESFTYEEIVNSNKENENA